MPTKITLRRPALAAAATAPTAPKTDAPSPPAAPAATAQLSNRWKGVIGVEGSPTGDGRMIDAGALGWADLPIPLRYAQSDEGAHAGAQVVGRIMSLSREGSLIMGEGDFDMGSEIGCEAQRQVALGLTSGISMDLDNIAFEYRVSAEAMASQDAMFEDDMLYAAKPPQPDDYPPDEADIGGPGGGQADALEPEADEAGRVTVMSFSPDDEMEVTTSARVRAATIVSLPAFAQCRISIVPDETLTPGSDSPPAPTSPEPPADEAVPSTPGQAGTPITASVSVAPPAAWFANPALTEPTPLSISEDGRIRGHLATWGTCHTGYADQCVSPPASPSKYAYFRTGAILTREGTEIATGRLTMDTRHAAADSGASSAMRHYDHTGTAVADVSAGEDAHGIWVAGALRTGLSPGQVRTLRASPLSGDWRRIAGSLELIAALAVNVPGFPVPRTAGLVASGRLQTLTASGMLAPRKVIPPHSPGAFSDDDLRYLKRLLAREKAEASQNALLQFRSVNAPRRAAVLAKAAALAATFAPAPPIPPAADKNNGWVQRDGKWVFDPDGDGDNDATPEGDTDHDYWDKNGKQIKAIPPDPDGKQGMPLPEAEAAPAPPAKTAAVRISLRPFVTTRK
jgi:hypothetical protein